MFRFLALIALFSLSINNVSASIFSAPDSTSGEKQHDRLVLQGGILVNGEGAPAVGPVDILIEKDRIVDIRSVGHPGVPIKESGRIKIKDGDKVINLEGHYILPGFIDTHAHIGSQAKNTPAEYVFKLWLAHGVTTVREAGSFNGVDFTIDHVNRSEKNTIVAPRIIPYFVFGMGRDEPISTAKQARKWVKDIKKKGAHGIKFFGATPKIISAALDEAKKQKLGTMMHHAQLNVVQTNVVDSARMGLTSMEHWYGLPEALFEHQTIQNYSPEYNYNNEQHRFGEAGRLWKQAASKGSDKWNAVRDELIEHDFTLSPTLTIYEASRDLMREMNADWHDEYTLPSLWEFWQPNRYAHGSYWFDWTTDDEIAWKENFKLWMSFLNDYKNHGGRVTTGSDSGYIFKSFGFGYIRELELLREAGFNALEVIQAATLNGAQLLGLDDEIGSVIIGKKADLVIVEENPLRNFKVLYGTGHFKLGDDNKPTRVGGVKYTIKDGVIYDARQLLEDVKKIVADAKAANSAP